MWGWQSSRTAVIGIASVVFVVGCMLPVGDLLAAPVGSTAASYGAIWLDARQRGLLYNTALLGTRAAILATAIGAPLGLALARKALLRLALAAPVLLPPYVVGLSWIYLGSSRGLVASCAQIAA